MPEITIRGINGAGDQVFKGETDADLVANLAKAQEHATRLIRKQAKQIATLQHLLTDALAVNSDRESIKPHPRLTNQ